MSRITMLALNYNIQVYSHGKKRIHLVHIFVLSTSGCNNILVLFRSLLLFICIFQFLDFLSFYGLICLFLCFCSCSSVLPRPPAQTLFVSARVLGFFWAHQFVFMFSVGLSAPQFFIVNHQCQPWFCVQVNPAYYQFAFQHLNPGPPVCTLGLKIPLTKILEIF